MMMSFEVVEGELEMCCSEITLVFPLLLIKGVDGDGIFRFYE
jgi:hypothetical protein